MNDNKTETPVTNPVPPAGAPAQTNQPATVAGVAPVAAAGNRPVSAFDLFPKSANVIWSNIVTFIILAIPSVAVGAIYFVTVMNTTKNLETTTSSYTNGAFSASASTSTNTGLGVGVIITLLLMVVVGIVSSALFEVALLRASEGKKITVPGVWNEGKNYILRLAGLQIVTSILTGLASLLLIIPGFIVFRRLSLASYALIDKNLGIGEAMQKSAEITKPFSGYIYSVLGVSILLYLVIIVPILGWIAAPILMGLYSAAFALRYQELKGNA